MRSVGKQLELLFDPVLHVAAGAIELLVESLWRPRKIGDDIAWVGAETIVLDPGNDPPFDRPGLGGIAELTKPPLLVAGFGKTSLGVDEPRRGQCGQPRVLGQADNVADRMPLAPAEQAWSAKAAVAAQDEAHRRPSLPQALDQQRQDRPAVFSGIERQKAVMVIIPVEKAPFLAAMH